MEQDPRAIPWHSLPVTAVTARLAVDPGLGLTGAEALRRRARYGDNSLTSQRGPGPLARLFLQLRQPLVAILLAAGFVAALIGQPVDAGVIAGVVAVNVLMGFFQEAKAVSALAALKRTLAPTATVLRDGVWSRIEARELVPGDVVALEAGDKVPADVRLTAASALRLDESALTGESVPVDKTPDAVAEATVLAERTCLAFAATVVVHGRGCGIVIGTGQAAEIGHIASLTATAEPLATPLTRAIEHFSRTVLLGILLLAGLALAIGTWRGQAPADVFMAGANIGTSRDKVSPDLRFYAGGSGSIRGYPYQTVGPLNGDTPIGGASVFTFSAELRWRITELIGLVPFLDGGSAFTEQLPPYRQELLLGAGLGLRIYTPVGPIRLDVATPLNRRKDIDDIAQFYCSIGQSF